MKIKTLTLGVLAMILSCASPKDELQKADLVFTNAKVYTVNPEQPWAEAVVVKGTDIVYVGDSAEAEAYIGETTEVIDAGGRIMLPGLIDTHCHLRIAGQANSVMLNLFETMTESPEVPMEIIRKHAESLGPDDWVLGTGWGAAQFPNPTKEVLDELVGGRPAILADDSQHNGWYSSAALEYFGIDDDTPNPAGGIIQRDENGEATGFLLEKAHIARGFAETPKLFTKEQQETAVKKGIELLNQQGITAIIEAAAITKEGGDAVYKRVHEKGELNARVSINAVHLSPMDDADNAIALDDRMFEGDEMLDLRTLKWAIDGIPGTMAFMHEPYNDGTHPPANYTQERLNAEVDKYTEMGYRMMFHAEGDAGIDRTLTALEYANETGKPFGPNDRHIITHLDHGDLGHFERMNKLDVIAQIQLHWPAPNDYNRATVFTNVKQELVDKMYDFRGMYNTGLHVAAGADWPTAPEWTPWELFQVGLTRKTVDGEGGVFPGERLTMEEMIEAFTIEGAYAIFREDLVGSLEPGKKADLIILDRDVFEVAKTDPMNLHDTKVVLTLLNGEVVWGGPNFEKTVEGSSATVEYADYVGRDDHICIPGVWNIKEEE